MCVSVNHRTAPFPLLDRMSSQPMNLGDLVTSARADGGVLVSTCNRVEFYAEIDSDTAVSAAEVTRLAAHALATHAGIDSTSLTEHAQMMTGSHVSVHLFAVASGLNSAVVGEAEIAGQVRRSLDEARQQGYATAELQRLFQAASATSRDIKNSTGISDVGRSIVRLGLDLVESRLQDWATSPILLIGSGSYASVTVRDLMRRGARRIAVHSPSGRQDEFAERHGLLAVADSELNEALAHSELVITCTNVQALTAEDLEPVTARRRDPLLVMDLGMPVNVEPTVGMIPRVELLNLETISRHAPVADLNASAHAQDLIEQAAAQFHRRQLASSAGPVISQLRAHIDEMLEAELRRLNRRGELDQTIEAALRHFAAALAHKPSAQLRQAALRGELASAHDAVSLIFGPTPLPATPVAAIQAEPDNESEAKQRRIS